MKGALANQECKKPCIAVNSRLMQSTCFRYCIQIEREGEGVGEGEGKGDKEREREHHTTDGLVGITIVTVYM